MNTQKLKLAVWLFVFSFAMPLSTHAYFTTNQTATKLSENAALFTVSYQFGFADRDLTMPITATRHLTDAGTFSLGYELLDDGEPESISISHAVVLASGAGVSIKEGKYVVSAGSSATFTLVVLAILSDEQLRANPDVALQVTKLPFVSTRLSDGHSIPGQLNSSELARYRTPELDM